MRIIEGQKTALNIPRITVNATRTHVTITSRDGTLTRSVAELRELASSPYVLPEVRQVYREMLAAAEMR